MQGPEPAALRYPFLRPSAHPTLKKKSQSSSRWRIWFPISIRLSSKNRPGGEMVSRQISVHRYLNL